MCSGFDIDKLTCDTNAVSGLPHATLEYVAHAKLPADLLHVDSLASVGKTGIARDHEQPVKARERHRDILNDAVDEIPLFGIGAQIGERENRD
jgi:hypothetical protein